MKFNGLRGIFPGSNGHRIAKYPVKLFNRKILKEIIDESFKVNTGDNYFHIVLQDNSIIYLEMEYRGVGIVVPNPGYGIPPHIRTIAVLPKYRHNGVATDLVDAVTEDFHKFNLRTLADNQDAIKLYSELVGEGAPFKAKNGMDFVGFLANHSPEEKPYALRYMAEQPYFFKNKK